MQIHELTQRCRTDEGFIDNLKATGQTLKKGYQQGGIGGALKAGTSNQAFAQAQTDIKVARETDAYAKQLTSQWKAQADQLLAKERSAAPVKSATAPAGTGPAGPKYGDPITAPSGEVISKPGDPSYDQLAKKLGLSEAFSDLPGARPTTGNTEKVYAQAFERWANEQLATKERNSGKEINLNTVKHDYPELVSQLATALKAVITSRADATANQEAVKNYLVTAMKGLQRVAARLRAENPRSFYSGGGRVGGARSVPGRMDSETEQLAAAMGITNDNLKKMKSIVQNAGETVRQGTGSNTIDNMLIAAGLLKA
jgi:hypothetical protein